MLKADSKRLDTESVAIVTQPFFENFHRINSLPIQSLSAIKLFKYEKRGTD